MDDRSFDRLARLLGEARDRRTGLKALVGGLFGAGGLAAADPGADAKRKGKGDAGPDAERRKKKRRKKCDPACDAGFECVKGTCTCASGVTCAGACCRSGQSCREGACSDAPDPATCIAFGEPCKDTGKRCCAGMTCASGQDGSFPVACYMTKAAPCERTAQCAYGMTCTNGVCLGNGEGGGGGVPTGQPCASGQNCNQSGAVCTAYTATSAPAGDFCTLPLRRACSGDPDCTCYKCWYVNGGAQGAGRNGRASTNTKACCHPPGQPCSSVNDCCNGLECLPNGTCGGPPMCVPQGGKAADGSCCPGLTVQNGICTSGGGGGPILGEACTNDGDLCADDTTCLCVGATCTCLLLVEEECDTAVGAGAGQNNWCEAGTTCRQYVDTSQDDYYYCLRGTGSTACTWDGECATEKCAKADPTDETGTCVECITDPACEKMKGAPDFCKRWSCDAGVCNQVAATNTLCTVGVVPGYCNASAACVSTVTGCDVDATASATAANLVTAIQNAPYKSAISIAGTFTLSSQIFLNKFGCNDNVNLDNGADCPEPFGTDPGSRVPWDVTLVVCPGKSAFIEGGSIVNTTGSDPSQWSWAGGNRIFHLRHYNLTIRGVNLRNAFAQPLEVTGFQYPGMGGAFYLENWDPPLPDNFLKLRDLTISGCKGDNGGVIDASYGLVDLKNVNLTKNWAMSRGGAMWVDLSHPNQQLKLDNVTMSLNVANNWETTVQASDPCSGGYCTGAGIFIQTDTLTPASTGTLTCTNQGASAINNTPQTVTPTAQEPNGIGDCAQDILNSTSTPTLSWTGCGCVITATDV